MVYCYVLLSMCNLDVIEDMWVMLKNRNIGDSGNSCIGGSDHTSHFAPMSTRPRWGVALPGYQPFNFALPKLLQWSIAAYSVEFVVLIHSCQKFGW